MSGETAARSWRVQTIFHWGRVQTAESAENEGENNKTNTAMHDGLFREFVGTACGGDAEDFLTGCCVNLQGAASLRDEAQVWNSSLQHFHYH